MKIDRAELFKLYHNNLAQPVYKDFYLVENVYVLNGTFCIYVPTLVDLSKLPI
jgi:hypothetical protein